MSTSSLQRALEATGAKVSADAPLAKRTWWRVGGPAQWLVSVTDAAQAAAVVAAASEHDVPLMVLGNASNLLVSDRGIPGVVLQLTGALTDSVLDEGGLLVCGAGLKLVVLLKRAGREGWTGLEAFAGIPGTVGGAVRMNAGQRLGETSDVLVDVQVVLADGTVRTLDLEALRMAYRTCHLPAQSVLLGARFRVALGDATASQSLIRQHLEHREQTQPLHLPSCGSTFRNPPGDHAGRLIEACGLKGFAIGAAQVSPKHANFIVNNGAARAAEIRRVIEHVEQTVRMRTGVSLRREVHYAGDWSDWPW